MYSVAPASATPPTQVLLTVTTPTDQQTYMMQFSSSKAPTGVTPTSLSQTTASLVSQSPKIYLLMSLKLNPATPLCTGHPKPNSALRPSNEHLPAS